MKIYRAGWRSLTSNKAVVLCYLHAFIHFLSPKSSFSLLFTQVCFSRESNSSPQVAVSASARSEGLVGKISSKKRT